MSAPSASAPILAVLGPTNTGKTHYAVERMLGHASGVIGFPLRLLAREIYDRVSARVGRGSAALVTGEEKIVPPGARYFLCTVESMPLDRRFDFLAIDEIQLCADPERGHIFTDRLLRARGREETAFLGSDSMRGLIRALAPGARFVSRPRFSTLSYAGKKKIGRLPKRSAVIGFSINDVYSLAEAIRRQRGGAAVVLGALSPRARNKQAQMFQAGEVDHLVATDAIGMGLNMDIDHVAFSSAAKYDGRKMRRLTTMEIGQIAGRAGRHMADGSFGVTDGIDGFAQETIDAVESHSVPPIRQARWRNAALEFSSIGFLLQSLDAPPPRAELTRARPADDHRALAALADDPEIRARAKGAAAVALLWDVCQIPDFQKIWSESHIRLVADLFRALVDRGRLSAAQLGEAVARLDRTDGDIDTLMQRLAQVRTWTYVTHRADWTEDAPGWREQTRAIEDRLSDALHDRLTQRFVDRRASTLKRALQRGDQLMSAIAPDGVVVVEGQPIGRLAGFVFIPDVAADRDETRALLTAARRALATETAMLVGKFEATDDAALRVDETGAILWREAEDRENPVARLAKGDHLLSPRAKLVDSDLLDGALRDRVQARVDAWVTRWLVQAIAPLTTLRRAIDAPESGLDAGSRAVAYQTLEGLGATRAEALRAQIKALSQDERKAIARLGLRLGVDFVFMPDMLKPKPAMTAALLWSLAREDTPAAAPLWLASGRTSAPAEDGVDDAFVEAVGYRRLGPRIVRVDMAERVGASARRLARDGPFWPTPELMSLTGAKKDEIGGILDALGYKRVAIGVPKPERPAAPTPPAQTPSTTQAENAAAAADAPVALVDLYAPRRRGREDRARRPQSKSEDGAQRRDRGPRKPGLKSGAAPDGRMDGRKDGDSGTARGARSPRREKAEKPLDPDNPFAKLLELKFDK